MNGDTYRTPDGRIGTEVASDEQRIRLVVPGEGFDCKAAWFWRATLKPETPRYEGARGGRA